MTQPQTTRLRLAAAALPALVLAGAALLLIVQLSQGRADSASPAAPERIGTPTAPGFPAPPDRAVVFARQDGENVVALAVTPAAKGRKLSLRSSVVGPDGVGVSGLALTFVVETPGGQSAFAPGEACGLGCYSASAATGAPGRVTVMLGKGVNHRHLVFDLPHAWPPADATALVRRSARVWRSLQTLVWHERLASGSHHTIKTVWRSAAPNRLRYDIAGGASAVVIGNRRWDRTSPTAAWQRSSQRPALRQPVPFWSDVRDARVVGSTTVRGRRAWRVTFFDPRTPAWFSAVLDRRTLRTLELQMLATAHFMHHVYRAFNEPLRLSPPR
jgi:hypothetical protein